MIKTVFRQNKENLEFTGLDFKAFFILMSSIDFIYIYGKNSAGSMNKDVNSILNFLNFYDWDFS